LSSNVLDNAVDVFGPSETLAHLRAVGSLLDNSVTAILHSLEDRCTYCKAFPS